jgi:superfamily II DNA or RNA helicase
MSFEYTLRAELNLSKGLDPERDSDLKFINRGLAQEKTASIILDHLKNYPGMILGDEVGMGKTWVALLAAIPIALTKNVLVLTPSKLMSNQWKKQYLDLVKLKFTGAAKCSEPATFEDLNELVETYDDFRDLIRCAKHNKNGIHICSIGLIDPKENYKALKASECLFELLILDEGHNFRNEQTQRYQIFKKTRDDLKFKEPLNGQSKRVLILTATPFQLGHHELKGVLSIIESTEAPVEMKLQFKLDLDKAIDSLDAYKERLNKFEHHFKACTPEEYAIFQTSLTAFSNNPEYDSGSLHVNALFGHFTALTIIRTDVNEALLKFLVRNSKDKKHREEVPTPVTLAPEKQLLFFLTDQLAKVRRTHNSNQGGTLAAVESSYARFEDYLNSMRGIESPLMSHYLKLTEDLFHAHYANEPHPKLSLIVEDSFQKWIRGEKSLIFCFFTKTVTELSGLLEARIRDHIEDQKNDVLSKYGDQLGNEIRSFREHIGLGSSLTSLVFKDSMFAVSLMPILTTNKLDPLEFLQADEVEQKDIVRFLHDIKFDPRKPNYDKLVAAFTIHSFSKFFDDHENLIPDPLSDDFEFVLDSSNFKEIFKRNNQSESEDQTSELSITISGYVANLIKEPDKLLKIMTHPTVWGHHREILAKMDIKVRMHITAIISAYLTSDEYFYLELMKHFTKAPTVEEITHFYRHSKISDRESAYIRICRFLNYASEMAEENLERLAKEMNHRYSINKSKAEKVIVETVTGDVNSEGKIRTVTAFRTPLPPYILISTAVLAEGVDLHTECRHVTHYDHEWNPAVLEQKTGRIDRVGSLADRESKSVWISYPYIKHTQDEKAFRVVMARKSWFGSVMGEKYETKWDSEDESSESIYKLPLEISEALQMKLDNEAHLNSIKKNV